jgi:hypothetical protein
LQHALYPVPAELLLDSQGACAGQATSLADHHGGSLDDRPSVITHLEIKIGNGLVGNRGRNDDAAANIDANMGRRGALRHIDNLSLELIACAEFHKNLPLLCQNRDSIAPSINIMQGNTELSLRVSNLVVSGLTRSEWREGATVRLEIEERRAVQAVKATHENVCTIDT